MTTATLETKLCRKLHFRATTSDDDEGPATLDYELPANLEAGEPPEARGLARDQVRLMVSRRDDEHVDHTEFRNIAEFLEEGDVLVINTSGTLNAALCGKRAATGEGVEVHLSTQLSGDRWAVELRRPSPQVTLPLPDAQAGETVTLAGGGVLRLLAPLRTDRESGDGVRLWEAAVEVEGPMLDYLERHGFPIRYSYVSDEWPLAYYQTVYAVEPGSAEMPSAGRAFTAELITKLVARGVQFAPVVLHTGVASLEDHEPPYAEADRVSATTARIVNEARRHGRRVIAVGTTAIRALETVAEEDGTVHAGEGWTELIIQAETPLRAVTGMLTGLHEPRATHLAMLLALAGPDHVCATYAQALDHGYLWHEFGDLHLIL